MTCVLCVLNRIRIRILWWTRCKPAAAIVVFIKFPSRNRTWEYLMIRSIVQAWHRIVFFFAFETIVYFVTGVIVRFAIAAVWERFISNGAIYIQRDNIFSLFIYSESQYGLLNYKWEFYTPLPLFKIQQIKIYKHN